jgi:hypothetical protein
LHALQGIRRNSSDVISAILIARFCSRLNKAAIVYSL